MFVSIFRHKKSNLAAEDKKFHVQFQLTWMQSLQIHQKINIDATNRTRFPESNQEKNVQSEVALAVVDIYYETNANSGTPNVAVATIKGTSSVNVILNLRNHHKETVDILLVAHHPLHKKRNIQKRPYITSSIFRYAKWTSNGRIN